MERYYINRESLENILKQYNRYCNGKIENGDTNGSNLQVNDIIEYLDGNNEKKEQIEKFLNTNVNLYEGVCE